jgi:glycosyltransferase involved in cell wall biosynthesis
MVTRFLELLEKWMYHSADVIVTVTQGLQQKILERVKLDTPIVLITNGVDLERFQTVERNDPFRERFHLGNRFVCSYVGTIGMAHGLDIVIDAAEALKSASQKNVVFLLVGDGADRQRLEHQVKARQLDEFVKFTGRLDKSEVPKVLASSDAHLVHLRKSELFEGALPSKIFETMAMQCPIILGVAGEAAELMRQAEAGVVIESSNAGQLIEAIASLAKNPELRRKLGQHGRAYVSQHFSRAVLAQNYLELIEKTVRPSSK